MNIPQLPTEGADRARWLKIAAAAWLLLVSVLAVVNSVGLSRLSEQSQASAQDAHMQALNTRVAELEQQSAASKSQPKPVTQPDFEAARKALDERLSQVEQAQTADNRAGDLQALQARMGDIEARLKKAATPVAAPRRTAEAVKPKAPEPPFSVAGLELRGGERFLSIAAPGVAAVRELRLLREGDAIGAWQLQVIEAHAAVFRVDGQTQRIVLP
jgi:BMFP domain-containing protein YqiC